MNWILPNNTTLSENEAKRLDLALRATWAIPLIRDIEGYIWETIFHYVKGLNIPQGNSTKELFDVVDATTHKGWSLKTLQWSSLTQNTSIEFIIQRADILKKAKGLGFNQLTAESHPDDLGRALVRHWNDKVEKDMKAQSIREPYLVILVKSNNRKEYVYIQEPLLTFDPNELTWSWTTPKEPKKGKVLKQEIIEEVLTEKQHLGLQAKSRRSGRSILKWYIGQKQLFQYLSIPTNAPRFTIEPQRLETDSFFKAAIDLLAQHKETEMLQHSLFQSDS